MKSSIVLHQIGSNDIEENPVDNVMQEIEDLTRITEESMPETKIMFAELLPRFYRDRNKTYVFEEKRQLFNKLLEDHCNDLDIGFVQHCTFNVSDFYDGIHLNQSGIALYVKYTKWILNPLLGIQGRAGNIQGKQSGEKHYPNMFSYENQTKNEYRNNDYMYNNNQRGNYRYSQGRNYNNHMTNGYQKSQGSYMNRNTGNERSYPYKGTYRNNSGISNSHSSQSDAYMYQNNNNMYQILQYMMNKMNNGYSY